MITCTSLLFLSASLFQQNNLQKIIGSWIPEGGNVDSRWVFTSDMKCVHYYENNASETFTFSFSTTSPQCGKPVETNEGTFYLKLENIEDSSDNYCYLLDVLSNNTLTLIYLGGTDFKPSVFKRWQ